jgi:hypothetical protein
MIRISICLSIVLLLLAACRSSSVPENILPPEKMQKIMWDIGRADELVAYYGLRDSSYISMEHYNEYYQKVFRIHKTTKEEFSRSLVYYESHPPLLKRVLDSVQKMGQRHQNLPDSLRSRPQVTDTLVRKNLSHLDSLKRKKGIIR